MENVSDNKRLAIRATKGRSDRRTGASLEQQAGEISSLKAWLWSQDKSEGGALVENQNLKLISVFQGL
jgi:hypothetical protein